MKPTSKSLSRRRFLQDAALLAGAAATTPLWAAPSPMPVVDTHIHLYDPNRPGGIPWPPTSDKVLYSPHLPPEFKAATKGVHLLGAIVIEANALPADNAWVLELARDNPFILGYIGRLTPGAPDFASTLAEYVKNPIFRGLRLHDDFLGANLEKKEVIDDLKRLDEHKLTVDLVGGAGVFDAARRIRKVAPSIPLVLDHLPFGGTDAEVNSFAAGLRSAAEVPDLFAKISYVLRRPNGQLTTDPAFYRERLDLLWQTFGEDRVIYGSNWPVSDLLGSYDDIFGVVRDYAVKRGQKAAAKYFWKNSVAAYHWRPRRNAPAKP